MGAVKSQNYLKFLMGFRRGFFHPEKSKLKAIGRNLVIFSWKCSCNAQNISYRNLQYKNIRIGLQKSHISKHTHTHTHSMNKSHTLVGLSCSSLFSLLSRAAASPSSLQTLRFSSSSFLLILSGSKWLEFELISRQHTRYRVNKLIKTFHWTYSEWLSLNRSVSLCITVWKVTENTYIRTWFDPER